MSATVSLGGRLVGDGQPCWVLAEIGINHNGDLDLALGLIDAAAAAGCDAVKFQKRTPELCVPQSERSRIRDTPWGQMTYMEYRERVEFGQAEFERIIERCAERGIAWLASCWDVLSVDFIAALDPPAFKIASASLTDDELLRRTRATGKPLILSTGMSSLEEVDHAVEVLGSHDLVLMHCTSTYPSKPAELNLRAIHTLRERYGVPVGYSGHEVGLSTTVAAVALGACAVERHITLDRAMWGSDQSASVEPEGLARLVKYIRVTEAALGDGVKRVYESEQPLMARLRRVVPLP